MSENKENALHISPEVKDRLVEARAAMIQQFNQHFSDNSLPPETLLALRSNISTLTQYIEPGTKEMWPDYSAAEKAYMKAQSEKRQHDGNNLAIAALGPLAAPAIAADNLGAPPETVGNFIELGFNMTAAVGLNKVGLRNLHNGMLDPVSEPVPYHRSTARMSGTSTADGLANRSGITKAVPEPDVEDIVSPQAMAQKHVRSALDLQKDSQPIRDWIRQGDLATLYPVIEELGGHNALHSANGKSIKEYGVTIGDLIDSYRQSFDGANMVIKDARRFVVRLMEDIASNGEMDPVKLQNVITQMQDGEYLGAHEFAALYYVRQLAHGKFVESKVRDFLDLAKIVNIKGENLTDGIAYVREHAEAESPYGKLGGERNRQPPASPESGYER